MPFYRESDFSCSSPDSLVDAIDIGLRAVTQKDVKAWFGACGYMTT